MITACRLRVTALVATLGVPSAASGACAVLQQTPFKVAMGERLASLKAAYLMQCFKPSPIPS